MGHLRATQIDADSDRRTRGGDSLGETGGDVVNSKASTEKADIARAGVLGTVQVGILCIIPSSSKVLKWMQTVPKYRDVVRMMGTAC